ncbi:MAG: phosphatase PAP2 family protein [Betaproteobacteria bacterium]
MNLVNAISDAGDSAVLIPLATLLVVILWRYQTRATASTLVVALAACASVMVVLKLVLIACGQSWHAGMVSPSGHASMSAAIYGALGIVAARQVPRWRLAIVLCSGFVIAAIAVSRVMLGAHSYAEVGLGFLVGAGALWLFAVRYLRLRTPPVNLLVLATLTLATIVLLNGTHLQTEFVLRKLALFGRTSTGVCLDG